MQHRPMLRPSHPRPLNRRGVPGTEMSPGTGLGWIPGAEEQEHEQEPAGLAV